MTLPDVKPCYNDSHAVVVGINKYTSAPPLGYAVSDAVAVAEILMKELAFPEANIRLLTDGQATRSAIIQAFLAFAWPGTDVNDRLLVFFAGHGHTIPSYKGEVGYLVPCDGDVQDLSTLVRWDELTRNTDLIKAKHVLFLMDACYGGLAIKRALQPGSMRFIKDMLMRPARQVLTAGKADEVVADLGGPLPGHSIFTGHLLEALSGKAAGSDGILTANGVMAYVYHEVGNDPVSEQTPHFGYLDGEGDLIFSSLDFLAKDEGKTDTDFLISVPALLSNEVEAMTILDEAKDYLSEERYRIKLHDLVNRATREAMSITAEDGFPVQGTWTEDEFVRRLNKYEVGTTDLRGIQALLAFWGTEAHRNALTLPVKQMGGRLKAESGLSVWLALRWYPLLLLLYCSGIAAIAAEKYDNLGALMHAKVSDPERAQRPVTLIANVGRVTQELASAFKSLPEHERQYVPRSEYLFKFLQPELDDILFLGKDYEWYFDEFEVLFALEYAEAYEGEGLGRIWGPPGRFAWKYHNGDQVSPLHRVLAQAKEQGESWPPIKAGLFRGSIERFQKIAVSYAEMIARLSWY